MRVAIIGANGQLGSDLVEIFKKSSDNVVFSLTRDDCNVEDFDKVNSVLKDINPDIILNTAAYHVVPDCEKNPLKAFSVNSVGAFNVARVADDLNAINVYYSTDYVFDGKKRKPYVESDLPNPLNIYGVSKLSGEYFTLNYCRKPYVLRISGIYGKVPCRAKGGNFITKILKLSKEKDLIKVVNDEYLTPTPTSEIAEHTRCLIETGEYGLYHFTSEGECSWFEFTKVIFEILDVKVKLIPVSSEEFSSPVKRPKYSVLENNRYNRLGLRKFKNWKESLIEFLKERYK